MKLNLPSIMKSVMLPVALLLVAGATFLPARAKAAPETKPRVVSVDYVLALMDAGIEDREIIRRIEAKNLSFRLSSTDLDRLKEAGAGKALIDVVTADAVSDDWERPNRMGGYETDQNGEGIEEIPNGGYGGAPSYGYYAPGYSSFYLSYGYPSYYAYPYYSYPYHHYYNTYYSSPYCNYPSHTYGYRTVPRGGSYSSAPRGSASSQSYHGGGGHRTAPRGGSHHH